MGVAMVMMKIVMKWIIPPFPTKLQEDEVNIAYKIKNHLSSQYALKQVPAIANTPNIIL